MVILIMNLKNKNGTPIYPDHRLFSILALNILRAGWQSICALATKLFPKPASLTNQASP